jgi:hypothetical protein
MEVTAAIAATRSLLVATHRRILPVYLLAVGVTVAAQAPVLVGLAVALILLRTQGRLTAAAEQLQTILDEATAPTGTAPPPGEVTGTPPVSDAMVEQFRALARTLLTPSVIAILAAAILLGIVVFLFARALANALQVTTVVAGFTGEQPLVDSLGGVPRYWRSFLGLIVARALAILVPTAVLGGAIAVVAVGGNPLAAVGLSILGGLVWLVVVIAASLVFLFVPQAIVVEDCGLVAAVRHNLAFLRSHPFRVLGYIFAVFAVLGGLGTAGGIASLLGVGRLVGLVSVVVVAPALAVFKTALYLDVEIQRGLEHGEGGRDNDDGDEADESADTQQ